VPHGDLQYIVQVHYLRDPEVHQVIVMQHGKIVGKGRCGVPRPAVTLGIYRKTVLLACGQGDRLFYFGGELGSSSVPMNKLHALCEATKWKARNASLVDLVVYTELSAENLPVGKRSPASSQITPAPSYEELEASGSFAALERPTSPIAAAPEDQLQRDGSIASVSGAQPAEARARSRSTTTSGGGNQRPRDGSGSSAPAPGLAPLVNGGAPSDNKAEEGSSSSSSVAVATRATIGNSGNTVTAAANSDNTGSVSEEPADTSVDVEATTATAEGGGGGGVVGKEDLAVEVGVDADADMGAEAENADTGELVAAEAEKWVGGVAVDRIRSLSSMYRSEEGSQSQAQHHQQQLPRSRTASTSARQEKEETGIEGGKELPPELVVAEDQEVCGLAA